MWSISFMINVSFFRSNSFVEKRFLLLLLFKKDVRIFDPMKNKFISNEDVKNKFGVNPDKVIDVQALAGDSSDNVPGVPGIGVKTAAELINKYGDLKTLLKSAGEIKQNKRRETLINIQG